jgi:RHS repeat-associated protein
MVLDEDGTVKEALMYQPYGTVSDVQGITIPGNDPLRQKFTTKEFDEEGDENGAPGIKAYYFGARMYDPDLSMWWSTDPKEQFFSPYAYTTNPLLFIDPNGQNFYMGVLFRQIALGAAQGAVSYTVQNAWKFESSMGIEEAIDWWAGLGASTIGGAVSGGLGFTSQYLLSNVIPTIRNAAGAYIVNSLLEIGMKSGSAMVTSALTQSFSGEVDKKQVLINGILAGGSAYLDILINGSLVNAQSLVSKEKKADMVKDFRIAEEHWAKIHYDGDYSEQ